MSQVETVKIILSVVRATALKAAITTRIKLGTGVIDHLVHLQESNIIPVKNASSMLESDLDSIKDFFETTVNYLKSELGIGAGDTLSLESNDDSLVPLQCLAEFEALLQAALLSHESFKDYNSADETQMRYIPSSNNIPTSMVRLISNNDILFIEISLVHAKAVCEALDLYTRLGIGQVQELEYLIRYGNIPRLSNSIKVAPYYDPTFATAIEAHVNSLRGILGYHRGESLGIGNRAVDLSVHINHETNKELEKALAIHKDPNPKFKGVNYDGAILRYTDEALPEIMIR